MKILAVVKFNDGEAFVLDKSPELIYTKYGNDTIIGTDGVFISSFGYEAPSKGFYAFGGRKFDIKLSNEEIEHCYGQWWDKLTKRGAEVINDTIIHVTAQSLDQLKSCYVFCGYRAIASEISFLRTLYTGRIYGYWEYEGVIKHKKPYRKDRVDFRKRKNHKRFNKVIYL